MNKKFIVPFDTAQQLREKGYPQESDSFQECDMYYYDDGELEAGIAVDTDDLEDCIYAPTYHDVVDWLEEKGIYITTCIDMLEVCGSGKIKWACFIFPFGGKETSIGGKHTREQALNASILKALEML